MQYTHKIIQLLPHREHCILTTKSKWLVTFRNKSIIYSKHHTKLTNGCCGLKADHLLSEQEAYIRYYCAFKRVHKGNQNIKKLISNSCQVYTSRDGKMIMAGKFVWM